MFTSPDCGNGVRISIQIALVSIYVGKEFYLVRVAATSRGIMAAKVHVGDEFY